MFFTSDGNGNIIYHDSMCDAFVTIADFREPSLWADVNWAKDKQGNKIKLSGKQTVELYKRISARYKTEVYNEKFDYISADLEDIDQSKSILEAEEG